MARPSKYTPEILKRITQYIADGLTISDACYGAGISADTFCRWRKEKPEFNRAINEATNAQTWSSVALVRTSDYRRYTRRQRSYKTQQKQSEWVDSRLEAQSALKTALNASQGYSQAGDKTFTLGAKLMTRSEPPTDACGEPVPCEPYFNTTTNKVEWVEKAMHGRCVLHRCRGGIWSQETGYL